MEIYRACAAECNGWSQRFCGARIIEEKKRPPIIVRIDLPFEYPIHIDQKIDAETMPVPEVVQVAVSVVKVREKPQSVVHACRVRREDRHIVGPEVERLVVHGAAGLAEVMELLVRLVIDDRVHFDDRGARLVDRVELRSHELAYLWMHPCGRVAPSATPGR